MPDYQQALQELHHNLTILREREAKHAGNAPLDLLAQIRDHEQAIAFTEQARRDQLTEPAWRESLRPLLVSIRDRSEQAPEACVVSIGDVDGGIIGSIIAGGDVTNVQVAYGSNIAQTSHGGTATVNVTDQRGQQVSGDQYNADNMTINQAEKESPAWRRWSIIVGIVTIIGVIGTVLAVPQFNALVFPEPTITPTPLPVTPAAEGESLILVATFHETGATKTEPHVKIKRAIEDAAAEVGLDTLRVAIEPTVLTADQRKEAETLGELYDAEMVIWGEDTGVQVLVNFYNLKQPDFDAADVKIREDKRTQLSNPSAYAEFILQDLPNHLTFLAFFAVGQSYYNSRQYQQAIKVIGSGIDTYSEDVGTDGIREAHFLLGLLYQLLDDQQSAITYYSKTIEFDPQDTDPYNNRGVAYYKLNQYEQALTDLTLAITYDPKNSAAYGNRGGVYAALNQYEQALADSNQAIEINPQDATAYYNRGSLHTEFEQYEQGLDDYNRAIEINPGYVGAYYNRGFSYFSLHQYEHALSDYNKVIELDPNDFVAINNRGNIYQELNQYEKALADYDHAIDLNTEYVEAYNNRGNTYHDLKQYQQALADFNRAIDLNPGLTVAYNNRGITYADLEQYEQALADFNRAIELDPENAAFYYNRGRAYALQGNLEQAIASFEAGLQIDRDPSFRQQAEIFLANLQSQLKNQQ